MPRRWSGKNAGKVEGGATNKHQGTTGEKTYKGYAVEPPAHYVDLRKNNLIEDDIEDVEPGEYL